MGDWAYNCYLSRDRQSFISFNYSCSEGETLGLLQLQGIVQIQISTKPDSNNYGKEYKARTVVDYLGKGKQYNYP
jgi:hypothetical protein